MGSSPGPGVTRYRRALEGLLGVPATEGNLVEVLRNGDQIFPAILDAISATTDTIDFLTFVYWEGAIGAELAQALADRAAAGVRVRVLLDAIGCRTMDRSLIERMSDAGADVEWFRPVGRHIRDAHHRTHRKVLICDEEVAFTGGVGIADEWRGQARDPSEWRDTHFRIRGPAVDGLRAAFVQNWAETGHPLFDEAVDRFPDQPRAGQSIVQAVRGTAQDGWNDVTTLARALVALARERIRITTAYFVPDEATRDALCAAAARGVRVEVLVPGPHADKRFVQLAGERQYESLLAAGVGIHTYLPTMLHAKILTVDGVVASVGSANFNARSLLLDDEVNLVVVDPAVTAVLDAHFDEDLAASAPVDAATWDERSLVQRAREAASSVIDSHL